MFKMEDALSREEICPGLQNQPSLCNLLQGINQINFAIEELLKESVQDNGDKIEDNT